MSWMQTTPLALLGLLFFLVLGAGVELGFRGHGWLRRWRGAGDAAQSAPDHLLTAVLGLLALLLGFTFSLALNRYEDRRELVVQEANAISTVWLRTQLLEDPNRTAMSRLLRDYVDVRLAWSDTDSQAVGLKETAALQAKIWTATGAAVRTDTSPQLSMALMTAVNQAFDLASSRIAERTAHIPTRVFFVLLLYAVLSMVMLGYIMGNGRQPHRIATTLLLVLLTLALVVILDLDRPRNGAIEVSQQPLEDLRASLR